MGEEGWVRMEEGRGDRYGCWGVKEEQNEVVYTR
jgi:hypothetical protein